MMTKTETREPVVLENSGQKIFGVMHLPTTGGKAPAVLICHGLAGHKCGRFRLYVDLAQKLAEAGIAALRIDFRGSGDSEGAFSDMTVESQIEDAMQGLDYLRHHPAVDSSRIGVFGRSFGGAIAVIAAKRQQDIKSIALWAPFFSGDPWLAHWKKVQCPTTSPEEKDMLMRVNGQLAGYAFFEEFFALDLKKELAPLQEIPMLHIHGDKDVRVSTDHADDYDTCRKHAKAETRFIRLPNSDHDFSHPPEQAIAIEETTEWFAQTLS